jgi:hypothetical protein
MSLWAPVLSVVKDFKSMNHRGHRVSQSKNTEGFAKPARSRSRNHNESTQNAFCIDRSVLALLQKWIGFALGTNRGERTVPGHDGGLIWQRQQFVMQGTHYFLERPSGQIGAPDAPCK